MANWTKVKLNKKQTTLSVVFIVAILVTLVLRIYYYNLAFEAPAPDYIVANDHVVAVAYNKQLYVLNKDGTLVVKNPFTKAGIKNDIADMQLLDSETILLADRGNAHIIKCTLYNFECTPLTISLDKHLGRFFKFYYRQDKNDLLLADTNRHAILHYNLETKQVTTVSLDNQFRYPNHLQFEDDGLLYVTNTNHHEISSYEFIDSRLQKQKAYKVPKSVTQLKWPIYFYRLTENQMFVLQANHVLEQPDLIFLENDLPRAIPTRPESDITVLAKMGNQLLMTDRHHFKVYRLDLSSLHLKEFGDLEFNTELAKGKSESEKWYELADAMLYFMIAIVIGLIAFIIILALTGKPALDKHFLDREFDAGTSNQPPSIPAGETVWLKKNPAFRYLLPGLFFMFVGMFGLMYWAFSSIEFTETLDNNSLEKLLVAVLLIGGIIILSFSMAFLNLYYQIGTDGKQLLFKRLTQIFKADPRDVLYTVQYIQFGNQTFTYQNNLKANFHDAAQFKYYITPLLSNFATEVKTHTIILNMLRRPNLYTIVSLSGFIIITATFFIYFGEDVMTRFSHNGN